jgi:hypothetical protein
VPDCCHYAFENLIGRTDCRNPVESRSGVMPQEGPRIFFVLPESLVDGLPVVVGPVD